MLTTLTLAAALREALPASLKDQADDIAISVLTVINEPNQSHILSSYSSALGSLTKNQVSAGGVVITLGEGNNQMGATVTISGDVAGGNIFKNSPIIIPIPKSITSTALHQLRDPVADFVGREKQISLIVEKCNQTLEQHSSSAIIGIRGMAGIGKTELAYAVAQCIQGNFSDGQILVSLLRSRDDALSPKQVLETVIQAFDTTSQLPDDIYALQGMYRSLLSTKRIIIVADNAQDANQIKPLIPPSGNVLLVTTRNRLTLPGMEVFDLELLSPQESERLLTRICPRIGNAAFSLAQLCGFLPLALRVSAGLIANTDTLSVSQAIERLQNERSRLRFLQDRYDMDLNVEASLTVSYELLAVEEQLTLRQISIFSTSFDLSAVISIVSLPDDLQPFLDDFLEALNRRNLLDFNQVTQRYSTHDLVRLFAYNRLSDDERVAVEQRYIVYYGLLAEQAEQELTGPQQAVWLQRIENEHDHMRTALHRSLESQDIEMALRLVNALWRFWERRGYLREGHQWLNNVIAQSRMLVSVQPSLAGPYAEALNGAGALALEQGAYVQAQIFYKESLSLRKMLGDQKHVAASLNNLGLVAFYKGDYQQAYGFYEESLCIFDTLNDRYGIAATIGNKGLIAQDQGDFAQAITWYEESLQIFRELGDKLSVATYLGNIGTALEYLEEHTRAQTVLEESLKIRRDLNDKWGNASCLEILGLVILHQGDLQQAMAYFHEGLTLYEDLGDQEGLIWILEGIAEAAGVNHQAVCATILLSAAEAQRQVHAIARPPFVQPRYDQMVYSLRMQLGELRYTTAWSEGQSLEIEQAIHLARHTLPE